MIRKIIKYLQLYVTVNIKIYFLCSLSRELLITIIS